MLNLYLTRHGETIWNTEGRLQGWHNDSPLTSKGINDAISLGKRINDINFDYIYSSPSGRTLHTAELIKGKKNVEITKAECLKEMSLGDWEGRCETEAAELIPEILDIYWKSPQNFKLDGAESFYDVENRVMNFINKVIADYNNTFKTINILIVTHSVPLVIMMKNFTGRSYEELWHPPDLSPGSLSLIEFNNNNTKIIFHGCTSHIFKEE